MDEAAVVERLKALEIETPSWGYGNSGTRFHVYPWPGAARNVHERIADAALVHRLTGCCPSVALHIPWDAVDDYGELRALRGRAGDPARRDQPEPVRRRRLPPRQPLPPGRRSARRRGPALPRLRRDREGGRLDAGQPLARRRDELPGSGRPARPPHPADRRARAGLRSPAGRDEAAGRIQVLRAGVLLDRPSRLGHGGARLPPARPAGTGAGRHRPPPAGHEHRADRRRPARRGAARRLPLQQPQVRGRRPDRRLGRPVRARSGSCARSPSGTPPGLPS